MNCSYCVREKNPLDMSREVLFAACDLSFSKGNSAGLCFFGGEPLLKKDLIYEALDYCQKKSIETGIPFKCKMTTNGTLLDDEFLKRAVEVNMGIGLSFDGLAQDVCRHFANGEKSSIGIVEEKAKLLLKYMPKSTAMMTIAPEAVTYYSDSVKYLYQLGFRRILVVIAYGPKVNWKDEDLVLLRTELQKTAGFIKEKTIPGKDFYIAPIDNKIMECVKGYNPARRCHLGQRQMPVTPKGKLYPCTSFIGDEDYCLGDVFAGVDDKKAMELARRSSLPESCRECELRNRCTNSCGCCNRLNTEDENQISPLQCEYERMVIEISDKLGEELFALNPELFKEKYG